ncbi:MAG: hypothetical protein Q9157_000584 [Trypethelium eluteriae]
MSGAFNNVVEPVHVRIGKDALATETRVSGQSSVNNEHTPQRDPSPDSMLLDAEETNELEGEQPTPAKAYERSAGSMSTDAEVWTLKASRPSTRHIQGSNSAHSNDQDSVREDHQIFQGISTERDWTRISTACDKLEGFLGSSRSDLKDGSPEQRLVFPTPDLDSRSVNTSRVESEDQAEGLEETNYAWRAFLHLPNETSELALGSARTQGSLSMNITEDRETLASQHPACAMGSRFGTTSAEGASQELNSSGTGVPVSSNYPQLEARERPGQSPRTFRHASLERLQILERVSSERSPAECDEDLWKRFVFGNESEHETQVLPHRPGQVPSSSGNGIPRASTWSITPLALKSSSLNSPV